jgi:hypothetical protein
MRSSSRSLYTIGRIGLLFNRLDSERLFARVCLPLMDIAPACYGSVPKVPRPGLVYYLTGCQGLRLLSAGLIAGSVSRLVGFSGIFFSFASSFITTNGFCLTTES